MYMILHLFLTAGSLRKCAPTETGVIGALSYHAVYVVGSPTFAVKPVYWLVHV